MNWFLGQSFLFLLLAFLLGVLVGWLWWRLGWRKVTTSELEARRASAAADLAAPAVDEPFDLEALVDAEQAQAPEAIEPPADVQPDDLRRIEGIGPRMAAALHGAGIHTFAQLADTDEATLQQAIRTAGLRFAPSLRTWARQARLLTERDEAGFDALTAQLVAGRHPGQA